MPIASPDIRTKLSPAYGILKTVAKHYKFILGICDHYYASYNHKSNSERIKLLHYISRRQQRPMWQAMPDIIYWLTLVGLCQCFETDSHAWSGFSDHNEQNSRLSCTNTGNKDTSVWIERTAKSLASDRMHTYRTHTMSMVVVETIIIHTFAVSSLIRKFLTVIRCFVSNFCPGIAISSAYLSSSSSSMSDIIIVKQSWVHYSTKIWAKTLVKLVF